MSYTIEIDAFTNAVWEHTARKFADYSIYQTWAYQRVRGEINGQKISRFIIKDENGHVASMGQIRIKCAKMLGLKVGYIQSGPLVRAIDGTLRCGIESLKALRTTYVGSRVNVLRIVPNLVNNAVGEKITGIIESAGFSKSLIVPTYHTLMLSLTESEEDIHKRLHGEWRRILRRAEKEGVEVREENSEESFSTLESLYFEAKARKGFKGINSEEFSRTQRLLSKDEKMQVFTAYYEGKPVSAHAVSHLGTTAVPVINASTEKGLKCGAAYLLWWKSFLVAKKLGMEYYDLGGIDPDENPKGYFFKKRTGGVETFHIGAFDMYSNQITQGLGHFAEKCCSFFMK